MRFAVILPIAIASVLSATAALRAGDACCADSKKTQACKAAEKSEQRKQTHCPVMGGKIKTDLYADVDGKRIYVCCEGCISKIKADPEKYILKLSKSGKGPEVIPAPGKEAPTDTARTIKQTVCPVMGGAVDSSSAYLDHQGRRIYVCCAGCVDQFKKDPAKYLRKLEETGTGAAN